MTDWFVGLTESEDELLIQLHREDGATFDFYLTNEMIATEEGGRLEIAEIRHDRPVAVHQRFAGSVKELSAILRNDD